MAAIDRSASPSQLFTIRLWIEDLDDRRQEYRGQVKHVVSGATCNFREWPDLEAFLTGTFENYEEGTHGEADGR